MDPTMPGLDPNERAADPSKKRPWRGVVLGALGGCLTLVVLGVVVLGLLARRQLATIVGHFEAVSRAAAAPGTSFVDPMLPAGVVVVDLIATAPELRVHEPATIHAGTKTGGWTPGAPAQLDGMSGERGCPISVSGPYLVEVVSIDGPAGAQGARLALRAIRVDPVAPLDPDPTMTPEKVLEIDLTRPDVLALRWRQGATVVAMVDLARSPGALAGLAAEVEAEWKQQRGHFDLLDQKVDQAFVRVAPTASFAEVLPVVEAILATKRLMRQGGADNAVGAFAVSVQPPLPPRPRAAPLPQDEGPPWKGPAARVRVGEPQVSGRLPLAVIQRIVATGEGEVRRCYVEGLRRAPRLQGRVTVRFVIGRDGAISRVTNGSSDLVDGAVADCILRSFEELSFPQPEGGIVTVSQPYVLSTAR